MAQINSYLFIFILSVLQVSCASNAKDGDFKLYWPTSSKEISKKWTFSHDGIDLSVPIGTPVYAAHKGVVIAPQRSSSYGIYIIIEYSDRWATLYAHLDQLHVKTGDVIMSRKKIGTSGNTGGVSGPHLHFELLKSKQPVDPLQFLPAS